MSTIAEGTPPSASPPPVPGGGPPRPDEPDLLAERRARRATAETAGEQVLLRRAEAAEATVKTLEAHVLSLQQRLAEADGDRRRTEDLAERLERVEGALETIRESHRRMAVTVGELRQVTSHLRALAERPVAPVSPAPVSPAPVDAGAASAPAGSPRAREEMAEALAAAVERLRARAQAVNGTIAEEAPASAPSAAPAPGTRRPHKHSMSLIGRLRYARKQRREAR